MLDQWRWSFETERLKTMTETMSKQSRDTITHHTPCSRECESANQAKIKLRQQDELFMMMHKKSAQLEEELKKARWKASTVTTLEDARKQMRRLRLSDRCKKSTTKRWLVSLRSRLVLGNPMRATPKGM